MRKKSKVLNIIITVIFVTGLIILLYPSVSNYINSKHASRVIKSYRETVDNADPDGLEKSFEAAEAYNKELAQKPEAFFKPEIISGYNSTLDITGTGIMGYVEIEKIGVELPIYHGVEKEVLQVGAGHLPGTSLPVGGNSTHSVLSGHRGLPSSKLFSDLDKMEIGDTFCIIIHDKVLTYQVDQIKIVLPTETDDLRIESGKDYCTLLTCTPYGVNSHRLLVRGVRVDTPENVDIRVINEAVKIDPVIVASIILIPLLVLAYLIIFLFDKKRRE